MCRESLIAYLLTDSKIEEEKIRDFVINHTANFTESEKTELIQKLNSVKICDPAVGSGAFPMGMLNELYACRHVIEEDTSPVDIKKEIVKENIYGVDIEKGAVDIARLRFWLAIIVDEIEPIPLPNLDYKIMQGNSLLESYEGIDLSNLSKSLANDLFGGSEQTIKKLVDAINGYFVPNDKLAKEKIRKQIEEYIYILLRERNLQDVEYEKLKKIDLHENNQFFLWHTWFNDVFNRPNDCNGGFDIVIGNPPYMNVTPDSIYKSLRIYNEISDGIVNTASLFLYYALIYLTSTYGIVSMIIPKSFYSVQSWKKIRNEILEKRTLIVVNDVGKAFENVGLEQGIVIVSKKYNSDNYVQVLNDFRIVNKVHQKYFKNNEIILTSCNKTIFEILKKIENILLGNIAEMPRGITEKSNAYETKKLTTNIHVLGGTNIKQYLMTDGNKRKPNRYINLNNTSINSKKDIFSKKRICYQNLMSSLPKIVATIVDENVPTDDTINNLVLTSNEYNYKILLAILNSNLCTFYLKYRLLNCAILTVHLDKPYVGKLPIPKITNCQEKTIISLVDQILAAKKADATSDTSELEHKIDEFVYQLYGLTPEEIAIVEEK